MPLTDGVLLARRHVGKPRTAVAQAVEKGMAMPCLAHGDPSGLRPPLSLAQSAGFPNTA